MPGTRSLADRLVDLREQANACRAQAIRLNAKLSLLERERDDLRGMRERLAASSARLDHAIDDLMRRARRW
ncbi:MAG TPA: hypothetical protein VFV99_33555 [Kofleriaceae bacterium]|nr:hypothetical protein [Kofleriaceae bacterium]